MKPTSKINNEGINKSTNNKEKKIIKKIKGKNATNNILNSVKKNNNLKSKKLHTIDVQLNRNHSEAKKGFIKKLNIKSTKGKVYTQLSQPKIQILLNSKNNNNFNKAIINNNLRNLKRPLSSKLTDDIIINKLNQDKSLKANTNKINNIKRLNLKQERNKNKSQDCIIRNKKNSKINNSKKKENSYVNQTLNKTNNSLSKINMSKNVKIKKIKEINNKNTLNNSKVNNKIKNVNNVGKNKKMINNKKTNNDSKISKVSKISKNKTNSNIKKIPINKEANNNKKISKNKKKFNSKTFSVKNFIKKDQNNKKEKNIKNKNNIKNKEKEVKSTDKIIKEKSNNANNEQKENNTNTNLKPNNEKVENADNNTNNNKAIDFHKILEISKKECELCHKKIVSHLYKIHYNTHASEIFPWLYLGSFNNACDIEELERIKATHVLNCAYECNNENLPKDIKELHLKLYDYEEFDISGFFEKAIDFINKCKSEEGVLLVHCKLGVSRSAALVLSYLIKNMGYTVDSALQFLVQKRDRVNPNKGFMKQLYSYERLNKEKKIEKEDEKEEEKENEKEDEKENGKEIENEKEIVKEKEIEKENEIEKSNIQTDKN